MAETREPIRVAINVMRARLTILGFNLMIITFQIRELSNLGSGVPLPGIEQTVHIPAAAALFLGMALTVIAIICFIVSSAFDQVGTCDHWSVLAGDLLMYLALAQTIVGFFGPFQYQIGQVTLPDPGQAQILNLVHSGVGIAGGIAWALATYLGPLISLLRSPFGRGITVALGLAYLLVLLLVARVWTMATQLQLQRLGQEEAAPSWLSGFVAPMVW